LDGKSPAALLLKTQGLINHALENPVFPRREVEIVDEIFMRASNS